MHLPVTDVERQRDEGVRRTEADDSTLPTWEGHPAVRAEPIETVPDRPARRAALNAIGRSAAAKPSPGPSAERSQDFLCGEDGLPA